MWVVPGSFMADDIFCLPDGPRILDCVEFDDRLRYGDVLGDVAFLAMDLERLGRPDLAERFLATYRAQTKPWPATLAHHYIAYRAQVRTKVACLRAAEGLPDTGEDPAALLELCLRHLHQGQVVLTLVGGPPATGKSTLAQALAARLGWSLLRSDDLRREVAADAGQEKGPAAMGTGAYRPELTEATYHLLLAQARKALELGCPVILDASWAHPRHRRAAAAVAQGASAVVVELRCVLDADAAAARAAHRRADDASDATSELARALAAGFTPWPGAVQIDAATAPEAMLDAALGAIDAQCRTGEAAGSDHARPPPGTTR